jgi:type IV pilus assembly protein PilM
MQRRCKHAAKNGSVAMPPWASKPGDTPWGFPIDCITGFQRITLDEKLDRTPLVENPGCFAVACGLAIQGLGQAHVQIDLRPAASKSAIKAVTGLFRQRYASQAWGLDLGSSSVKAVKLAWDKKTETISMESAALVQYKKPLSQAASEEEEQAIIEEAMTAFLAQNELKADHVCLSLPGRLVLTRIFQLPTSDRTKMSTMVQFEAKRHAPTNLDQLDWDFQPLAAPDEEDDSASAKQSETKKGSTAVLFVASRSKLVRKRIDLMKRLGVRVESAQSECIALHNFLMYDLAPPAQSEATNGNAEAARPKWPIAVVDVGGDGGNLLVSSPTGVWVRHLGFGGYSVTRALIKYFNLTAAQADELKRNPAAAPSISEIYRTLEPIMDDFSRELGVSLAAYAKADHYEPVERMYCLGGGFQLHGLLAYLRTASNDEA